MLPVSEMGDSCRGEDMGVFPITERFSLKFSSTHIEASSRPPESSLPSRSVRLFQYSHNAS